jgi:hypothetical protein
MREARQCRECGVEFEPRRRDQVYHSRDCKWKAAHRRNRYPPQPRDRREYMRAYRQSPAVLRVERERQIRYRQRPEVRLRRREYDKDYRQRPGPQESKRQRTRDQRRRLREEKLQIDFIRFREALARRLEMVALIETKQNLTAQLRELSTEQLRQELIDRLGLTAESLLRTACLVAILEERGEDLSGLKIGLLDHLRKIAQGQLLPEIVVRFAGDGRLIRRIAELPIPDQQRILAGEDPKAVLQWKKKQHAPQSLTGHRNGRENEEGRTFQRPEEVVKQGGPRDVAQYLFGMVMNHPDPQLVMAQLRNLFTKWEADGKRRRLVLAETEAG